MAQFGCKIDPDSFKAVETALEAADIEFEIFNVDDMLNDDYHGPIEIVCENQRQYDLFYQTIATVTGEAI